MKHYERAKLARDDYENLTGIRPPYPKSKKDLNELLDSLTNIEFQRLANIEIAPKFYEKTMGKYLKEYRLDVEYVYDLLQFTKDIKPQVKRILKNELKERGPIKFAICAEVSLIKPLTGESAFPVFRTSQIALLLNTEINGLLEGIPTFLQALLENFISNGSGWVVNEIKTVWIEIAKYQPLKGGSYMSLPRKLSNKKCVINPKNEKDNLCFYYCYLMSKIKVEKNPQRINRYKDALNDLLYIERGNKKIRKHPSEVDLGYIPTFERKENTAINVFGWDNKKQEVIIHRITNQPEDMERINLLLIERDEKKHYVYIKDFNRLLYDQTKHKERKNFCITCLWGFSTKELLDRHRPDCRRLQQRAVAITMPEEGSKLEFINFHKQLKVPYIIYADFECIIIPLQGAAMDPEKIDPEKSSTIQTSMHEACSYSYVVVRSDGKSKTPVTFRGDNAAENFIDSLLEVEKELLEDLEYLKYKVIITRKEEEEYKKATICHICEELLNGDKVLDHDHITGFYRGPAHNQCNLKLRINKYRLKIPVVFHNLRGYDSHLLMQVIGKFKGKGKNITCIPNNTEKYISFSLGNLRFIDSAQFLASGLDKLVDSMKEDDFKITKKSVPDINERKLLIRKGVYPYEYMDSWKRFDEKSLPPKEAFYSKLSGKDISEEDYKHAQKVWKVFECKTLGDYCDLYCRTDVLLLADAFENFRNTCSLEYKLDPANYFTSPGLSWDALLKSSKVKLDLLSDVDMYMFIEKGLRGGMSTVSKRHAIANNPRVKGYNPKKPTKYIMYLDANSLYPWAMSQPLPTSNFEWVENIDRLREKILDHPDNDSKGYFLEVDLEYPEKLHDYHNDYPLAPERVKVEYEETSDYQKSFGVKTDNTTKLISNLKDKNKYVLHYRVLKLYVELGMKIKKIHKAIQFDQSPWMKDYIMHNTELRKQASKDESKFGVNLFKLMNNSVFGKTMENLRKRCNVELEQPGDKLKKLISSTSYKRSTIFNDDLAAVEMHKKKLLLNRPIYVGMAILDLSKLLMYDFYYKKLGEMYPQSKYELLYTDTDSLIIEIETEDVYADMASEKYKNLFDTSNYPPNHPSFDETNRKVLGKMKDECFGNPIIEFVGLRSKMYSVKSEEVNISKAKGVKNSVIKKYLHHDLYYDVLVKKAKLHHSMNVLRSMKHEIFGQELNKVSLSAYDSKRYILDDGVNTRAYGHYLNI